MLQKLWTRKSRNLRESLQLFPVTATHRHTACIWKFSDIQRKQLVKVSNFQNLHVCTEADFMAMSVINTGQLWGF